MGLEQALANKQRDEAQLVAAQLVLDRYAKLLASATQTQEAYDNHKATVGQLEASIKADQAQIEAAQLNLDYAQIRSPIDGRTGARLVDPGNLVQASQGGNPRYDRADPADFRELLGAARYLSKKVSAIRPGASLQSSPMLQTTRPYWRKVSSRLSTTRSTSLPERSISRPPLRTRTGDSGPASSSTPGSSSRPGTMPLRFRRRQ